jgi:glycopeptide antibiotics resistance protein
MFKARLSCIIAVVVVIALGLLSRKISFVPLWVGDVLWALMVYLGMRALLIRSSLKQVVLISLLFCFAIEFSQLYQAPWINNIRATVLGHLVLGQGFLWGDLLAYVVGVGLGYGLSHTALFKKSVNH